MKSNLLLSLTAAIALAVAGAQAHAQPTIVIGNFEGANNSNNDGWDGQNGTTVSNFNGFSSTATLGTGALAVTSPAFNSGANGFVWSIMLDNNDRPTLGADILSHPFLMADVTWVASQWSDSTPLDATDNWAKWDVYAVNDNTGWQQFPASGDNQNPSFPGSWDSSAGTRTQTVTWPLAGQIVDPNGFVQLWMSVNRSTTSFPGQKVFWIDNIRLAGGVPEPASLSLGALALLSLLRIRREMN